MNLLEPTASPLTVVESQIAFSAICGKPVAIFRSHHYALLPWQRWAAAESEPVRILSLDYHTDKHRAFLRYGYRTAVEDCDDRDAVAEQARRTRLEALSARDTGSVAAAVLDLQHDEHIDAALRSGIIDLAFVASHEDQGYLPSNEQLAFDREWQHLDFVEMQIRGLVRPNQNASSTYSIPESRLIILDDDTPRPDEAAYRHWRNQVIDGQFLKDRLDLIERICRTGSVPHLFELPFILDIDLDAFNTRQSMSPEDASVFYDLIRRSIGVTIAQEPNCVRECQIDGERLTAPWLQKQLLNHLRRALC
ncbi:MAG: UPF0489 family protein [Acetobacteraceae bacterium]|nr:UPF0489 family protein [Acetobacteraceae bacterium]